VTAEEDVLPILRFCEASLPKRVISAWHGSCGCPMRLSFDSVAGLHNASEICVFEFDISPLLSVASSKHHAHSHHRHLLFLTAPRWRMVVSARRRYYW
jgi:hypothetical protein